MSGTNGKTSNPKQIDPLLLSKMLEKGLERRRKGEPVFKVEIDEVLSSEEPGRRELARLNALWE